MLNHHKRKWRIRLILVTGMLVVFISGFIGYRLLSGSSADPLLLVNSEAVSLDEYQLVMEQKKAEVYSYFTSKHGVQPGDLKWENTYARDRPIDMLVQKSVDQVLLNRATFHVAEGLGNIHYTSFEVFKEEWKKENDLRKGAATSGQVVYGPTEFSIDQYYDFVLSNISHASQKSYYQSLHVTEDELKDYYSEIKEAFTIPKALTAKLIESSFAGEDGKYSEELERGAEKAIKQASLLLANQGPSESTLQYIGKLPQITVKEVEFNERTQMYDENMHSELREQAMNMQVGQVSPVIRNPDTLAIVMPTEVFPERIQPFEEAALSVEQQYEAKLYAEKIEELTKEARVEIKQRELTEATLDMLHD